MPCLPRFFSRFLESREYAAVIAAHVKISGVVVRPFIDRAAAEFTTDAAGVTTYTKAPIRAWIVSATDKRAGWPDPEIVPTPEPKTTAEKIAALSKIGKQRRLRRWVL